jgi:hypothetical protein|tara:strand:+ start:228 stop:572 length:345 start_codon:yes stop_codon:yes gene_type:complete
MLRQNYRETITKKSLEMLIIDRCNEFSELASAILIPQTKGGWEKYVLDYCMNIDDAFKVWSGEEKSNKLNVDHQTMILLRMISRGQTSMNDVVHLLNLAYTIAQEFKEIYKRLG